MNELWLKCFNDTAVLIYNPEGMLKGVCLEKYNYPFYREWEIYLRRINEFNSKVVIC